MRTCVGLFFVQCECKAIKIQPQPVSDPGHKYCKLKCLLDEEQNELINTFLQTALFYTGCSFQTLFFKIHPFFLCLCLQLVIVNFL